MARVKLLDEQLANQIAAGEVVERPSSVVKELVENAIDAGSTTIDVTVEEGGLAYIRVTDNGDGIEQEDMVTAFERHATSKISTSSDLFRIASLGFRGEALPSIAAVAKVECISSINQSGLAHKLIIEGGKRIVDEPCNAPRGTDMIVKDLFFNTPARLKYMKSIQTELGHISDYMNRIALAHPGIAITLKHNGNMLLRTLGTGDRLQVIAAIYGTSTAKTMMAIDGSDPDYEIIGYISKPELTRANRNGMTVIVNGRYIKSIAVNHAITEAYHTLLPINRFPLAVIEIQMHPALLDVNVHPSKLEVRFSKEVELKALIEKAVREKLGNLRYTPGMDAVKRPERVGPSLVQDSISFHVADGGLQYAAPSKQITFGNDQSRDTKSTAGNRSYDVQSGTSEYIPKDATSRLYGRATGSSYRTDEVKVSSNSGMMGDEMKQQHRAEYTENQSHNIDNDAQLPQSANVDSSSIQNIDTNVSSNNANESEQMPSSKTYNLQGWQQQGYPNQSGHSGQRNIDFPELHWIGQHHGTYIIAQSNDGLYLIDQHAAHERINYEYYLYKFGHPQLASQQLLVPITMEFTPGEAEALRELLPYMEQAGVSMEPFGQQTYLVRAYPEWLPKGQEQMILEEMTDYVISERKKIDITKFREQAAIMCSCKASIKANDRMNREEGEVLLRRLAACSQPYTCPHGRPIIVHLSTYQLEKMFKRVMS
ncbi:MAG: DNA mismatch repair endonuclease MutL [Candidatus Pristimantibacillus lignocellulolyticus]|uniref:DNA mismatch repair protein MutL n=1 Tax=Candidatus Pristimantibacillus lignocellulolyticus TaxID=2994561 RepID=A0A9J6ZD03_9BACL|nr:MAG: DNA mismatch repair endonuclease MutL [Candidatus Pristimantibacillus lignocellulolyticus]